MKKRILAVMLVSVMTITALLGTNVLAQELIGAVDLEFITAPNEQERNRMWQADLEQLKEAVMQRHAKFWDDSVIFVPHDVMSASEAGTEVLWLELERNERLRQGFVNAMNSLIADVPNLTDAEIAISMQSAVALLQDNHFNILPQVFFDTDPYLPLEFKHFGGAGGGFYLTRTTEEFAHVLNHRVTYINGIPISNVAERFRGFVSVENIYNLRAELASFLDSTLALNVLGLRENGESTFVFEDSIGNVVEITFTEEHESLERFEFIHGRVEGELPRFLHSQGINRFYFLEDYGVLYIRIEGYMPTVLMGAMEMAQDRDVIDFDELEEEIREAIAEGLFQGIVVPPIGVSPEDWMSTEEGRFNWEIHPDLLEVIEQNDIRAAVIDARNNPGGDPAPFFNLFRFLGDNVDEGKLFYFANAGSASASILSAMGMHYMGATFVGEPLGQNTVFYGLTTSEIESGRIDRSLEVELKYTGFFIDIPNLLAHIEGANVGLTYLHLDFDTKAFLERTPNFEWYAFRPHVLIEHTIDHWINNIDPLLEYVIGQVSAASTSNISFGEIGYRHLVYMQNYLPNRIAFTHSERDAAEWIVSELLRIGYSEDDIYIQEFLFPVFGDDLPDNVIPMTEVMADMREGFEVLEVSQNIIAVSRGTSDKIIVVGAHYDSVLTPGISDNGSGVALILESAEHIFNQDTYYTIKFVFFGAEEVGILGASYFVESLTDEQIDNIVLMINADVLFDYETLFFAAGYHNPETNSTGHNNVSRRIKQLAEYLDLDLVLVDEGIYLPSDQLPFVDKGFTVAVFYALNMDVYSPAQIEDIMRQFQEMLEAEEYTPVSEGEEAEYDWEDEGYAPRFGDVLHTENDNLAYIEATYPGRIKRALRNYGIFLNEILLLSNLGGYAYDTHEDMPITRGEFVYILIERFSEDVGSYRHFFNTRAENNFDDVEAGHPFYNAILIARGEGLIRGDGSGNFNPDDFISGTQAAVLLNNILGWNHDLVTYNTTLNLPYWAVGAANVLLDLQIVSPHLIAQNTLTRVDALIFIDAIERAALYLER